MPRPLGNLNDLISCGICGLSEESPVHRTPLRCWGGKQLCPNWKEHHFFRPVQLYIAVFETWHQQCYEHSDCMPSTTIYLTMEDGWRAMAAWIRSRFEAEADVGFEVDDEGNIVDDPDDVIDPFRMIISNDRCYFTATVDDGRYYDTADLRWLRIETTYEE